MTSVLKRRYLDQSFIEMSQHSRRVTRSSKRAATYPTENNVAQKKSRISKDDAEKVEVDSYYNISNISASTFAITSDKSISGSRNIARATRTSCQREPHVVENTTIKSKSGDYIQSDEGTETEISITVVKCPPTQQALVVAAKNTYALIDDHPIPIVSQNEVLIKNHAVGINHIDWMSVDYNFCLPEFPWVTGREMAGVVKEVGSDVKDWKVGDKVWTSTYYRDSRAGCFQEFVTVPHHTVCPIPENLDFKSAACLGVAALTAAMTLWKWLEVPMYTRDLTAALEDKKEMEYLLIWGGSTITGQFAIQLAVKSEIKVIAVTSEKTRSLVKELGAEVVSRDGKTDEEIVAAIRRIGGDKITKGIDLVGTNTAALCLSAFSTNYPVIFTPLAMMASSQVVPENVTVETVEMKRFVLDEASKIYSVELNKLIESESIKLPEIEVMDGGLSVVEHGLARIKTGDMAGKKVVVSLT